MSKETTTIKIGKFEFTHQEGQTGGDLWIYDTKDGDGMPVPVAELEQILEEFYNSRF